MGMGGEEAWAEVLSEFDAGLIETLWRKTQ
jgi:hypothetical protein